MKNDEVTPNSSIMAPIIINKKSIDIYERYISFGLRDRQQINAKEVDGDTNTSIKKGNGVARLKRVIYDKIIDHEVIFKPLLFAVGSGNEKEENNDTKNEFGLDIVKPLKYHVMAIHEDKTNLENIFQELNIAKLYFKDYESHKFTLISNNRKLRHCLFLFENNFLKINRSHVTQTFTNTMQRSLQGSGRELKMGLQMMFEAGNYPNIHNISNLSSMAQQIDEVIELLSNEDASDLWPLIISALWAWCHTHDMRKFLVQRGLLDCISPLSLKELVFRIAIRDVVRLASGLLAAVTCESQHCNMLLQKGAFLSCIELLETPKTRNMQTKQNLVLVTYNCIFEAEESNMIDFALEKKAEFSLGRKHEKDTIINRLFVIFQQVFDSRDPICNAFHAMLSSIICIISCYSKGFKAILKVDDKKIVENLIITLKKVLLLEEEEKSKSVIVNTHATDVISALTKCLWAVCYHVDNILKSQFDDELLTLLLTLTRHDNQQISYCALVALGCTNHVRFYFDKDCVISMNNHLYHGSLMCKTFAISILAGQMKLTYDSETLQHTISHLVHIVCDQSMDEVCIQSMRLVYEIIVHNPSIRLLDHDIKNLLWLLKHTDDNLTLKVLVVLSLWALCREALPLTETEKKALIDILHHNVIEMKEAGQIDALNHIVILIWQLSYDEIVQEHIFTSQYLHTFATIITDIIVEDDREPSMLLVSQPINHFPDEESAISRRENPYNILYDILLKLLSVLSEDKAIGDKLMQQNFYDTLIRIITIPSVAPMVTISCTKMLQLLCSNENYAKTIKAQVNNDMVFSTILTILMKRNSQQLQEYVAACVSSLASDKDRRSFVVLGGGRKLIASIKTQLFKNPSSLNGSRINALFNLSVCKKNRFHLCKIGLKPLLLVARNRLISKDIRDSAGKTLRNLKLHPSNLSAFYKIELQTKTDEAFGKATSQPRGRSKMNNLRRPQSAAPVFAGGRRGGRISGRELDRDSMQLKQSYIKWFDKLNNTLSDSRKTNGPSRLFAPRRPSTAGAGRHQGHRPPTRPRSPRSRPSTAGAFGGRRSQTGKAKHELINRMRQPTSRLWKTSPIRSRKRRGKKKNKKTMKVNPWEPDIHHYEDLDISENPEMKTFGSTSPVKVVLSPPHSPRSLMKFGGSGKPARDKGENGQMIMWKYIEGNRISKALNLKVYEQPDGTKVHYFFKQGTAEPKFIEKATVPSKPTELTVFPSQPAPIEIKREKPSVAWPPLHRILSEPNPPISDTNMMSSYCTKVSENNICFYAIGSDEYNPRKEPLVPKSHTKSQYELAFEADWNAIMGRNLFSNFVKGNASATYFGVGDVVEVVDAETKKARKADVRFILEDRVTVVYQRDRRKAVVHIDEVRHTRPPRGQEITVNEALNIPLFQLKTLHGCNIANMERISKFSLGVIDTESIENLATSNKDDKEIEVTVQISGHDEHVRHAKYLLNQMRMIGKVENMLRKHHGELTRIFNYFCSLNPSGSMLHIQEIEFFFLMSEIKFIEPMSKMCNRHHIREVYEFVSSQGDQLLKRKHNSKRVRRFEFMEVIMRCAYIKYGASRKVEVGISLELFMEESMHIAFANYFGDDGSKFRKEFFSHEHIEEICEKNIELLAVIYVTFTQNYDGVDSMRLNNFIHFLDKFKLFEANFTKREASYIFTLCIEDINENAIQLDFIGFLEGIFRVAGSKKLPSMHAMELLGVRTFTEYYKKKNTSAKISHLRQISVSNHAHWMIHERQKMEVTENIPYIKRFISYIQIQHNDGIKLEERYSGISVFKFDDHVKKIINQFETYGLERSKWEKPAKKRSFFKPVASYKRPPPRLKYS